MQEPSKLQIVELQNNIKLVYLQTVQNSMKFSIEKN